jgi:hypothetical protein
MSSDAPQPPIVPGPPPEQTPTFAAMMPTPVVPKKRVHPLSIVLAVVGGVALLCGAVLAIGSFAASNKAATASSSPSTVFVYVTPPAAQPTRPAAPTTPPPPVVPTVDDGTWTVGTDLPAGKYRTKANVGSDCYWAILKSGTNGADIVSNDIPGGGRPTVTLSAGQDFKTSRCGTWEKIG